MFDSIEYRIGQMMLSEGRITHIIAYNQDEEKLLIKSGFVRSGSTVGKDGCILNLFVLEKVKKTTVPDILKFPKVEPEIGIPPFNPPGIPRPRIPTWPETWTITGDDNPWKTNDTTIIRANFIKNSDQD